MSSVPPASLTPPSIDLVGTYTLTAYHRNGIDIGTSGADLEIGPTHLYMQGPSTPPPWVSGIYPYTLTSTSSGDYIRAKVGPVTKYVVFISTDNSMTLRTWIQENNVLYETFWQKISDGQGAG